MKLKNSIKKQSNLQDKIISMKHPYYLQKLKKYYNTQLTEENKSIEDLSSPSYIIKLFVVSKPGTLSAAPTISKHSYIISIATSNKYKNIKKKQPSMLIKPIYGSHRHTTTSSSVLLIVSYNITMEL